MKKLKALYVGMAMTAAAAALTSCQADMETPALVEPVATMKANTTLSEFKTAFADQTVLCPMKDEATQTPYIIKGRVISSDATGNIYKSIVIQDETAALAISINQGSTYTDYRLGQEIVLNATGLYIGYYNGLQQIGWLDEYNDAPSLTFLAWDFFLAHSELNGFPNVDVKYVGQDSSTWPAENPYCIVTTFSQLPSSGEEFRNMQSQLVEFRNVYFEDGGKETYAPYQESVNRTLKDANGGEIIVRTSGYSNFYNEIIPEGTGTVRGILSYYGDAWQLLLRGLDDVMITEKGQKNDPYTIAEAIEAQNESYDGWVTAYIVGSVKAGVNNVSSNDDIIFGADAEMDNNLVIAQSEDVTDWTQCMAVDLPQGSTLRQYGNLVDNPAVYKKPILVSGTLATYLGMPGVQGTGGSDTFEIAGVEIGGDTPANGNGTKESPYSVAQVMTSTADNAETWVEGYVVGYVPAMTWSEAVFGNTATAGSTNWSNGTNFILSDQPVGSASADNSIPVGLATAVRNDLAISKNPAIYGAKVKVKGEMTKYFGLRGIKNVSEFEIIDGTGGGGDTPAVPGNGEGTKTSPYNVGQVMSSTTDKAETWVVGYVVGYAPTAYWSDALFGNTPTEGSTNWSNGTNFILSDQPVGSASADNSIPVGLATAVRNDLAISKNPSIYGAKVKVKGEMTKYFGVRGIKNVSEFEIVEGGSGSGTTPTPDVPGVGAKGDGTEANPFNIAYVQGSSTDASGVWIVGYVAGYVPAMTWTDGVFGTTPTEGSTNYTNGTNCILSDVAPTASNVDNSVPCGLSTAGDVRATLGISKNPSIYGKKVMVKGDVTKYFGIRGIKNVSEYKILN